MYSRSVTPTPGHGDQVEARNDLAVGSYSLTKVTSNDPGPTGSSVKYFNYSSSNFLPVKSLAQEMLDAECQCEIDSDIIYNESSKLLGDDN